ncbi:MAG: phospholipase D-like domain-containing protein, partial [Nocardioidaceae bacterium]
MLRKAWAVLATAALLIGLTAGSAAAAYAPKPGPLFNNPRGDRAAKNRILSHVVSSINHTPRHGTIRIAAYSFDRPDIADALIAAHKRDVDVQMVLNDNWTSKQTLRLRRVLGEDPNRRSFVVICRASCRGGAGNQHMKFYLFSQVGTAKDVSMIGSANLTGYGALMQWNDLFTIVNNYAVRNLYSRIFEQLVRDHRVAKPYLVRRVGGYEHRFYPHPNTTEATDPVMRRFNHVSCRATGGTGRNGHTMIRIIMYGWNTPRGVYLAQKVADLAHDVRLGDASVAHQLLEDRRVEVALREVVHDRVQVVPLHQRAVAGQVGRPDHRDVLDRADLGEQVELHVLVARASAAGGAADRHEAAAV